MTTSRPSSSPSLNRAGLLRDAALLGVLVVLAALAPEALRFSSGLALKLGPLDQRYTQGFRPEAEREGSTWFHWTQVASRLHLPFILEGEGFELVLRVRRHFIEPAHVKLRVEDRIVDAFDLRAQEGAAYHVVQVPLGPLAGARPFRLDIEAPSEGASRGLGIAVDWIEVRRTGSGSLGLLPPARLRILLVVVVAFLAPALAGAGRGGAGAHALLTLLALAWYLARDPVACERTLADGASAYAVVGIVAAALGSWLSRAERWGEGAASVAMVTLVALALRLVLLLHPSFFYPDLLVHSRFTWQLVRTGLGRFLAEYLRHQFQFSLGLQQMGGHWYAFPYPPLLYLAAAPLVRLAGESPETAVVLVASSLNALEAFLFYGLALALTGSRRVALLTAAALPLLPIFLVRLALAYFPAISGGALDMLVLLWLASSFERFREAPRVLALGAALALVFLTYTQSILNFGVLLGVFLPWEWLRERSSRRACLGVLCGLALGGLLSFGAFYYRYVPGILDMRAGRAPADEHVLLDKPVQADLEPRIPEEDKNPFFGPDVDLLRGLRKAAFRLWVFYGPFAFAIPVGLVLVGKQATPRAARLVAAWGLHYLLMNLGSGGLPSPNLLRYNKEMEFVAALFCLALAALAAWLWERVKALSVAEATLFLGWCAWRVAPYFGGTLPRVP